MLQISKIDITGWEAAIRGMRNPKNSWDRSDSNFDCTGYYSSEECECLHCDGYCLGDNDLSLMLQLSKAGTDHSKFLRMITVTLDINAPLYWWKEADTYKVGTVANSCSTMHKIHAKEFTVEDFSCEHLDCWSKSTLNHIIGTLNHYRHKFIETGDKDNWWQMIQLLPTSYNQLRTVQLNYQVLANIYKSRKYHKLDEWRDFCKWIESLPYAEIITGGE